MMRTTMKAALVVALVLTGILGQARADTYTFEWTTAQIKAAFNAANPSVFPNGGDMSDNAFYGMAAAPQGLSSFTWVATPTPLPGNGGWGVATGWPSADTVGYYDFPVDGGPSYAPIPLVTDNANVDGYAYSGGTVGVYIPDTLVWQITIDTPDAITGPIDWQWCAMGMPLDASGNDNGRDFWFDDDVCVTIATTGEPVPEPATMALLGIGVAGFCAARKRR